MADTGNILQPLSTNHTSTSTTSPGRSTNKVRILWRGSLILPNGGVPLPGLSIISTHLPSASSSSFSPPRPRRTRIRTADVFGTPITPIEEDVIAGLDEREGEGEGDEAESDLTLAIEVLRHAPLVVQTHTTTACSKKDDLDLDQWVVSSSTSLSLDSAHWSTIDYLHRTLLPSTSSSSSISRVSLTISPPMQDPVIQPQGTKNGNNKRLLPPAAPFDVFSSPPNEFAIIPVLIPSPTPPPLDKKRSGTTSSSQQQTIRLALAQRRRPTPTQAEQTPALPLKHVVAAAATSTPGERGLSATKKRMTVAARNKNVIAAGAALNSATTAGPPSRLRTTSTTTTTTTTTSSSLAPSITAAVASVGGQHLQPVTTSSASSSNVPTRTLVRQQIKRLTRYALLSRGMVESPSSSKSSSQAAETSSGQQDDYGPCLRAIVAATETMLKPDLDALPPGAPMPSLTRIASWVKVHVEMYAPPLPRTCIPPGS